MQHDGGYELVKLFTLIRALLLLIVLQFVSRWSRKLFIYDHCPYELSYLSTCTLIDPSL